MNKTVSTPAKALLRFAGGLLVVLQLGGCGEDGPLDLDAQQLMDPKACKKCHPQHYRQWSGSMHAYASRDPLFIAMNARGQRETKGELGEFCVSCHAPMAVRSGETTDGLNLDRLPDYLHGVTCYFCHSVEAVEGSHNNPLTLADDGVLRASIEDPVKNTAHRADYSKLHDGSELESAKLCGSCHDIVTPKGVHLERTFAEWNGALFSNREAKRRLTCSECHMKGRKDVAAQAPGVHLRRVHDHTFAGVDLALTDFPDKKAQRESVQRMLDTTVATQLCVLRNAAGAQVRVTLENIGAGHSWPSGAAQDRRAWVEVIAFVKDREVFSSGKLADDKPLVELEEKDKQLWRLGDYIFDEQKKEVHMFWDAASYKSALLPAPTAASPLDPKWIDTHLLRSYTIAGWKPTKVTMRVRIRPMGLDVLDSLIKSKDLDAKHRSAIPTFTLKASRLTWTESLNKSCVSAQ